MESMGYSVIDNIGYNDSTNVSTCGHTLVKPDPLLTIDGNTFSEFEINQANWIKIEAIGKKMIHQQQPVIEVDGQGLVKPLVRSIEEAATKSRTICIKLKTDRSSIKLLRKSLKTLGRGLKRNDTDSNYKWKAKVTSFMRSIKGYDEVNYETSTGESESEGEGEGKVRKNLEKCKKIKLVGYVDQGRETKKPGLKKKEFTPLRYPIPRGENMWIYCGNFFRNGRLVKKELPRDFSLSNRMQLERRIEASKKVNPDPNVFAHVYHEIPWEEADWGPLLEQKLNNEIINRVLKGMSQGRLYNIDYLRLSQIFRSLIEEDKYLKSSCPLCGKVYLRRASVIMHIESIHTNFVGFCGACGNWMSRSEACTKHKCSA